MINASRDVTMKQPDSNLTVTVNRKSHKLVSTRTLDVSLSASFDLDVE